MDRKDTLIKRKFYKYLLPGIMMVAAMQLGNLVDSIFVGNLLGSNALSAQNIALPVVYFSQLPMMIFSYGGSIVASICLGKREEKNASLVFSSTLFITFIFCLINAGCSVFYSFPLANILTKTEYLAEMAADFMLVSVAGMPLIAIGLFMGSFLAIDNHPVESAALHIMANALNLVTDYIFIKLMSMGIIGSALSTVVGYGVAGIFFACFYYFSKKRTLSLKWKGVFSDKQLIAAAFKNGLASGMLLLLSTIRLFILNAGILAITGSAGMAIYSVCVSSFFLVMLCLNGISGVLQTIGGVLYGEKDYYGVRVVLRKVVRISVSVAIVLMLIFLIFPGTVASMFGFTNSLYADEMNKCLRVYACSFGFYAINYVIQTYYSTIEKPFLATLNTVLQGFAILVPATLLLLPATGVVGTSIGAIIAEALALTTVVIVRKVLQKRGKIDGTGFDALPEVDSNQYADITFEASKGAAATAAKRLKAFCLEQGFGNKAANVLAIAGEELIDNIAQYGDRRKLTIDLCIRKTEDTIVMRIRDDGPPFNPLLVSAPEAKDDLPEITGLELIKKMALRLDYSRVLNMNNTIVETPLMEESV